jgi:hypothetical protein
MAPIHRPIDMHFNELGYRYFAEAIETGLNVEID